MQNSRAKIWKSQNTIFVMCFSWPIHISLCKEYNKGTPGEISGQKYLKFAENFEKQS